ncbi:MAG TPA: kynureninase [Acidimicrobiales bacterium]|nr:kynureninase [Acidimicrobiales bacterium]
MPTRADAEALDAADPVAGYRDRFVLDDDHQIYLDGNSLGRPARSTVDRVSQLVEAWGHRLVGGWQDWEHLPLDVGDRLGRAVLGAGPGQVAVTDSTTVNLYKLAGAALDMKHPRRPVIVGDRHDFPTDRYVLEGLAAAHHAELRLVDTDPVEGPTCEALEAVIDPKRTALVCLSHVNYRSAARAQMAQVTELAHANDALMLWDLSHSAGAVPLHVDADGVDLAIGCSYKYLNAGPGAPAFLYVRQGLQAALRQPIWGWFGQRDQFAMGQGYDPEPNIRRFLAGSPPILGVAAVAAGVELLGEAGIERLWAKSEALTALAIDLFDGWLAPLGCRLASPRETSRRGAHIAIGHPDGWQLCRALIERAAVVPDFRPPDVIRLGPVPIYTRFVDVLDACDRLRQLLSTGEYRQVHASPRRIT